MVQHDHVQNSTQPATVLIVEDDLDTRAYVEQVLGMDGYSTIAVSSGEEALKALSQASIDLVVLDLMLPDISGYDLCQKIRANSNDSIPIIMVSALSQPENVVRGLEEGADDYLRKPFFTEELLARIEHLLRRRESARKFTQENVLLQQQLANMAQEVGALQQASTTEALLRREFLHNVSTHLQALCGIVDAELRKLPPSPERETVQRLRSRVYGAALVYQTSEAVSADLVPIGPLIRTITQALKQIYRPWRRVLVDVTGDDLSLPNWVAAPLAMVVNELVTNCCKHAFPNNSFGKIMVSYYIDSGTFHLVVADNGVGFNSEKPTTGAGRTAVTKLIQGLNGTINWQSSNEGTQVDVRVPVENQAAVAQR